MAVSICISLLLLFVSSSAKKHDKGTDLLMPKVSPKTHDTYYCHPMKMSEEPMYITGFEPHAKKETAHHMLLYGCEVAGMDKDLWNCGEMAVTDDHAPVDLGPVCKRGAKILYAWAMDAPDLELPSGVGFEVGGDSGINYLVLQVHYALVEKFVNNPELTDESGMTLHMTPHKQPLLAGVYLIDAYGIIPKGETVKQESACIYLDDAVMHPFAFRTHTHALGKVVSGYRVRESDNGDIEWTEIGRRDPQLPQMFYPITKEVLIEKGDVLAARCLMENNLDHDVSTGSTMKDEMCNFYMMYYIDKDEHMTYRVCSNLVSWEDDLHVPDYIDELASTVPDDQEEDIMNM